MDAAYYDKDVRSVVCCHTDMISAFRELFVESCHAALELQMEEVLTRPTKPVADHIKENNVSAVVA